MTSYLNAEWLRNSYNEYVERWLWQKWGYSNCWAHHFAEMLLWYSAAGAAVLNETAADDFVAKVRRNQVDRLPEARRRNWEGALQLTHELCVKQAVNPVDWYTGACGSLEAAWRRLDEIPYIGAKIASFIMRDLSFMRDCLDKGGTYSIDRDRRWFDRLSAENQALFMPIDVYVHAAAWKHGASQAVKEHDAPAIQGDPVLHRQTGTEIVNWARRHGFDPRDLNVYWYSLGAENIRVDGTPVECLKWS